MLKVLRPDEAYYWATHQGAEIDLVLFKHGHRIGVECKRMDAPTLTPSMRIALNDLMLDRLIVVYPGDRRYALTDDVEVIPLIELVGARTKCRKLWETRADSCRTGVRLRAGPTHEPPDAPLPDAIATGAEPLHAFFGVLTRAKKQGELDPDKDPRTLARFLTTMMQGSIVMIKAGASADAVKQSTEMALSTLE